MELNSFDKRLRWAMEAQGMKQADLIRLASEMGVKLGKSQVSQYVSGKTAPRKEVLFTLASILSVEPSWLQTDCQKFYPPFFLTGYIPRFKLKDAVQNSEVHRVQNLVQPKMNL